MYSNKDVNAISNNKNEILKRLLVKSPIQIRKPLYARKLSQIDEEDLTSRDSLSESSGGTADTSIGEDTSWRFSAF